MKYALPPYSLIGRNDGTSVPIALEARAVSGLGDGAVLLGTQPEEYMLGTTYAQLHQNNPKLDKLLVDTMLGMCAQMMAMAAAFLGVAWFSLGFLALIFRERDGFPTLQAGKVIIHGHADFFHRLRPDSLDGLQLLGRHVGQSFHGRDACTLELLDDTFAETFDAL